MTTLTMMITLMREWKAWPSVKVDSRKLKNSSPDSNVAFDDYKDGIFHGVEGAAVTAASPEDVLLEAEGDDADHDDYEDETLEDAKEISESWDPFGARKGAVVSERLDSKGSEYAVLFVAAHPKDWTGCTTSSLDGLYVTCPNDGFRITFPPGLLTEVQVVGTTNMSAQQAPEYCRYRMDHVNNTLTLPFTGCHVKEEDDDVYILQLFVNTSSQAEEFRVFCVESSKFVSGQLPRVSASDPNCKKRTMPAKPPKCFPQSTVSAPSVPYNPSHAKSRGSLQRSSAPGAAKPPKSLHRTAAPATPPSPLNCAVGVKERIPCGPSGASASMCRKSGCCSDGSCYYPLDECTADRHFVFAIRQHSASVPVEPRSLFFPGEPLCKPTIVNQEVAVFKVKFTDCGAHSYEHGDMEIHQLEVHTVVQPLTLKYGKVTRSDPLRFLVECRFSKPSAAQQSVSRPGFTLSSSPSSVVSGDRHSVQLRIAKDHTYSSYFSASHQPLRFLLGHPVYLELRLRSPPHPDAVILVNYCLARPRSATNGMVLVYERCSNPDDPSVSVLKVKDFPDSCHQRRFVVDAFRSMSLKTDVFLNEEIYFLCSTDVCDPNQRSCEERCLDGRLDQQTPETWR
ncbi:uncharacterized protein LOC101157662 isoform X2 [Oryzias latipes]